MTALIHRHTEALHLPFNTQLFRQTISVTEPQNNEYAIVPCMPPPLLNTPQSITVPTGTSTINVHNVTILYLKPEERLLVTLTCTGPGEIRMEDGV
jgi:hypothetical protein